MRDFTLLESKLKALANNRRLRILHHLKKKHSVTVSALAKVLGISIEATSKHLSILKAAGIVRSKKRKLYVTYRLALHQDPLVKHILKRL